MFRRVRLDLNRCPRGSIRGGHTSARCWDRPSVSAPSSCTLYHVYTWAFTLEMCDALENFCGFGVSCLASSPHGGSYRITFCGTSHPFPMRRRSLLFPCNIGSTTAPRGLSLSGTLPLREDHHQLRGGDKIRSSISRLLASLYWNSETPWIAPPFSRKGGWWKQEEAESAPSASGCRWR